MTEPLLLALTVLGVAMLLEWASRRGRDVRPWSCRPARCSALACLTRYEAWPVTCAALAAAVWTRWRRGETPGRGLPPGRRHRRLSDAGAHRRSRSSAASSSAQWFVSSDFFVPENKALGRPFAAAAEIVWGTRAAERRDVWLRWAVPACWRCSVAASGRPAQRAVCSSRCRSVRPPRCRGWRSSRAIRSASATWSR